jgi:hypothetical protein
VFRRTSLDTTVIVAGASIRADSTFDADGDRLGDGPDRSVIVGTSTLDESATTIWLLAVAKPDRLTAIEYVPLETFRKTYSPRASVMLDRRMPVPTSVTVAPGTGAADSSTTVPDTVGFEHQPRSQRVHKSRSDQGANHALLL